MKNFGKGATVIVAGLIAGGLFAKFTGSAPEARSPQCARGFYDPIGQRCLVDQRFKEECEARNGAYLDAGFCVESTSR